MYPKYSAVCMLCVNAVCVICVRSTAQSVCSQWYVSAPSVWCVFEVQRCLYTVWSMSEVQRCLYTVWSMSEVQRCLYTVWSMSEVQRCLYTVWSMSEVQRCLYTLWSMSEVQRQRASRAPGLARPSISLIGSVLKGHFNTKQRRAAAHSWRGLGRGPRGLSCWHDQGQLFPHSMTSRRLVGAR